MDSMPMYDDDSDCGDQCFMENIDYMDYEFSLDQKTLPELYNDCIYPTLHGTFSYIMPLILISFICNIASRINFISHAIFHCIVAVTGTFAIWYYASECIFLLLFFTFLSYLFLHLPKKYRSGTKVFLPSFLLILYCQFFMESKDWNRIRGYIMIAAMKASSVAVDVAEIENPVNVYEYMGYMLCSATSVFGPWVSFEIYVNLYKKTSWKYWWIFIVTGYMIIAFVCLCLSDCWAKWILSDSAEKWLLALRDAIIFRTSHYFICFTSSSIMLAGGYPLHQTLITKPLEIEVPRSLVQVVINWNISMHNYLKSYIFRPSRKQFGKFGAIIMTYAASSLLHGLNFQLSAVLLSLGFYTFIEYQLRNLLANVFDACIASKQCSLHKCEHSKTPLNCYWVVLVNIAFGALAVFHLAYLGCPFDTSDSQEIGYNYSHTIEKWSQLGFASHWIAFATYCAYYLIR